MRSQNINNCWNWIRWQVLRGWHYQIQLQVDPQIVKAFPWLRFWGKLLVYFWRQPHRWLSQLCKKNMKLNISHFSVCHKTHTLAICLSVHVLFRALQFCLCFFEVWHPCVFEAASWIPPPLCTPPTMTHWPVTSASILPRLTMCPHGNLYLPPLTVGEAGLSCRVDMSIWSEWHWQRSRNGLKAESTEETQQLVWFGSSELWWHMSPAKHLFAVAKPTLLAQHMSSCSYYRPCVQNSSHNTLKSSLSLIPAISYCLHQRWEFPPLTL